MASLASTLVASRDLVFATIDRYREGHACTSCWARPPPSRLSPRRVRSLTCTTPRAHCTALHRRGPSWSQDCPNPPNRRDTATTVRTHWRPWSLVPPTRRRAAQSTQQRASYQSPQSLRARELARFAYSNSEGVSHAPVRDAGECVAGGSSGGSSHQSAPRPPRAKLATTTHSTSTNNYEYTGLY